jgi:hypothetical protein
MRWKSGEMIDETMENLEKVYVSKYNVKHMEMSLKVEIISAICKPILDSL